MQGQTEHKECLRPPLDDARPVSEVSKTTTKKRGNVVIILFV